MKKFRNSNLSIYRPEYNFDNNVSMISILGRVSVITFTMFIVFLFVLYPHSWDLCLMSVSDQLGGFGSGSRFMLEDYLAKYQQFLLYQAATHQEQTANEYLMRVLLEYREVIGQNHLYQQGILDNGVQRYTDYGIGIVVSLAYFVILLLNVIALSFFDFMFRKPIQNRNLSVYEEFILDFVFNIPRRTIIAGLAMSVASTAAYTFDAWVCL